jgi:hypothetical protein
MPEDKATRASLKPINKSPELSLGSVMIGVKFYRKEYSFLP